MSLIKLSNVSKFYYNKGVIASGFNKVNLSFDIGEFIAITGESGSGKSTLLNVISGLDSYEEGEMYINGEETSHYTEENFEEYRRKYVGNIFQSFNLVNSYTVYQNIELVLLLNGKKKKEIKNEVIELIKKVDLYKFRNTKVSKLSGGQKQRVAIARALAKNTPMIIADEPTGNLDSRSAKEVLRLLSEIAKDKLVIVVTHNYDQVSEYATRKIKMHDGKVIEDQKLKDFDKVKDDGEKDYKDITFLNKIRLSIRNCFNIIPKFLLLLAVYLFITISLISEYASFKKQEYVESIGGYNYIFVNTDDKRIVIKKNDKTAFTEEEYERIKSLDNVKSVVKNDVLLDTNISFTDEENFWLGGFANELSNLEGELDLGRMPENDNEIVLLGNKDDYYIGTVGAELFDKDIYIQNYFDGLVNRDSKLRVTGIKYSNNDNDYNVYAYVSNKVINELNYQINQSNSVSKIFFLNKYRETNPWEVNFKIIPSNRVPKGAA
jgi:ABC-type lipoprotein export system ATPase subunit